MSSVGVTNASAPCDIICGGKEERLTHCFRHSCKKGRRAAQAVQPGRNILKLLVTAAAGYIGTHTLLQLLAAGHELRVMDNFSNASLVAQTHVRQRSNRDFETICTAT